MSAKELQLLETQIVSKEKLLSYLDSMGITDKLNESQKEQFIEVAQCFGLNPFKREIHAVAYRDNYTNTTKLSIITGYEVYIKRADRTGKLDGWKAFVTGSGNNMVGHVEIFRKDWSKPFQHDVYFNEVAKRNNKGQLTNFWKNSPKFQLKKVAISQGFRLAFPDELAGIPYTADELPDDMAGRDVTPKYDEDYNKQHIEDVKGTEESEIREISKLQKMKPLTYEEIADIHDKETGGKARTKPLEHTTAWARSRIDLFEYDDKNGCYYLKDKKQEKLNINDQPEKNKIVYREIMTLINTKDNNNKDMFTVQEKIKYKKSADKIMNNLEALTLFKEAIIRQDEIEEIETATDSINPGMDDAVEKGFEEVY